MPNEKEMRKLEKEQTKVEAQLRAEQHKKEYLDKVKRSLTWKERTHRLCTRGGMLETFLEGPELLTDDQVMAVLKVAFHKQEVGEIIERFIRENKGKERQGDS